MKVFFKKLSFWIFTLTVLLISYGREASAASISDVSEAVDPAKRCSISVTYQCGTKTFPNLKTEIFRVADVEEGFSFRTESSFSEYQIDFGKISSQRDWNSLADTLEGCIDSAGIEPTATSTTDASGTVVYENLPVGVYFLKSQNISSGSVRYCFDAFILSVPDIDQDGTLNYAVTAAPKAETFEPTQEKVRYAVLKQWKDRDHTDQRPEEVTVELYQDGDLFDTVVLSSQNNWIYQWRTLDNGAKWAVREKNVPNGYTVSVSRNRTTFIITNKYSSTGSPGGSQSLQTPRTGDRFNAFLWIVLCAVSGMGLILTGLQTRGREKKI